MILTKDIFGSFLNILSRKKTVPAKLVESTISREANTSSSKEMMVPYDGIVVAAMQARLLDEIVTRVVARNDLFAYLVD